MIRTGTECKDCPHAYYVTGKNGRSELVGCLGHRIQQGMVIKNNGEGLTCMVSDKGIVVYSQDIDYCPLWHH